MYVFKTPSKAVLNIPCLDESILFLANSRNNNLLGSIGKEFCKYFDWHTYKRNWPIIIRRFRIIILGYQSYIGIVDRSKLYNFIIKIINEFVEILLDDVPTFLHE